MTLPPYDPDTVCAKCADEHAETAYCHGVPPGSTRALENPELTTVQRGEERRWLRDFCDRFLEGEHQHRRCRRCGYLWIEACWTREPERPRKRPRRRPDDAEPEP